MPYLIRNDYLLPIQDKNLTSIIQGKDGLRLKAEQEAQEQIRENLVQKYDIGAEFTETLPWDYNKTYNAGDRIVIDYPVYDPIKTYPINSLTIYQGNGYISNFAIVVAEAFNIAHWSLIAPQYTIYYAAYPAVCTYPASIAEPNAPIFNYLSFYNLNDIIFWKNYTYVCARATQGISQTEMLQYITYANVPYYNVFPDDVINNAASQFWKTKTSYSIAAHTLPSDAKWIKGDNRSQSILRRYLAISIYLMHHNVAPQNVPEHREREYDEALRWLKQAREGVIVPLTPLLQPSKGRAVRYGGDVANQNSY